MRYANLKDYMRRKRLKQKDLAKKIGISQSFLSLIANGKANPSLVVAARIERISGIPPATFISNAVSAEPPPTNVTDGTKEEE
jgi:transcriptional regulator with XRE-family HTH domain